jgi:hypothetical protein
MVKGTFSHAISGSRVIVAAVEITRNKSRNVSHLVESFFPPFYYYIFLSIIHIRRPGKNTNWDLYIVCSQNSHLFLP